MTLFPYNQPNILAPNLPRIDLKKPRFKFFRNLFFRLDYLPPALPPEMLKRQTIWEQLEEIALRDIAPSKN